MKLIFLYIFLQSSFTFSPSDPNVPYFVRSTVHSHFLSGTEHDPHLYETSKFIAAYTLVFKFSGSGKKNKSLELHAFEIVEIIIPLRQSFMLCPYHTYQRALTHICP
jgi:hypothetical protein